MNKQSDLLKHLASGATLKEIAKKLNISYNTIKTRTKLLYKKFGINSRSGLISKAIELKLLTRKDVKKKFQKRFFNKNISIKIPDINEPLTKQEITYLSLIIQGMNTKKIIKKMSLVSIYHAQYIQNSICYKLNAANINQSILIAYRHGII